MHGTVGRSDWDDGRWEWEDTPRRDARNSSSRHYRHSPMYVGASPDARLVSPWLGGRTPNSSGKSHNFHNFFRLKFGVILSGFLNETFS